MSNNQGGPRAEGEDIEVPNLINTKPRLRDKIPDHINLHMKTSINKENFLKYKHRNWEDNDTDYENLSPNSSVCGSSALDVTKELSDKMEDEILQDNQNNVSQAETIDMEIENEQKTKTTSAEYKDTQSQLIKGKVNAITPSKGHQTSTNQENMILDLSTNSPHQDKFKT